jgi:hypothetical protein
VSTTATSAASGEWTVPAIGNLLVAAAIIGFFVLACVGSATRSDVTTGFDEPAHASYVAHIQQTGDAWPDLKRLRLLDPHTFEFTGEPNYLNHPPLFYALLATFGPPSAGAGGVSPLRCRARCRRLGRAAGARPHGTVFARGVLRLRHAAAVDSNPGAARRRGE